MCRKLFLFAHCWEKLFFSEIHFVLSGFSQQMTDLNLLWKGKLLVVHFFIHPYMLTFISALLWKCKHTFQEMSHTNDESYFCQMFSQILIYFNVKRMHCWNSAHDRKDVGSNLVFVKHYMVMPGRFRRYLAWLLNVRQFMRWVVTEIHKFYTYSFNYNVTSITVNCLSNATSAFVQNQIVN
jgi:hypothetical protein